MLKRAIAFGCALYLVGAAAAEAQSPRVLVFHPDPAGNPEISAGVSAIKDLGRPGGFQVTTTQRATDFTGANLARYRAVVFLNTPGNRLNGEQRGALEDYLGTGGGFVGIGRAAEGEPGSALFDDLIGARPDPASPTGASTQTLAVGDRVHPSTRDLPLELNRTDVWYRWQTRPTGKVHTVARFHALSAPPGDGTSVGGTDHPISWCRDVRGGRSFYTGMGRTAASYSEAQLRAHLLGAIQWSAGLVRGNCKATINANYRGTRLVSGGEVATGLATSGESHGLVVAPNGWVLYIGRGDCRTDQERGALVGLPALPRILDHADQNVGLGCGSIHVWDPAKDTGAVNSGVTRAGTLAVYGDGGQGGERTNTDRPQARVGPARHHRGARLHDDGPHLRAVLPELQPLELAAGPAGRAAHLQAEPPADLALHDRLRHQAADHELGGADLRVRRPDLQLLPRRRRHGLRLAGQPLRHDR